ncbi:Gfo/Idh/MocA family oxidoreductase [Streptosporangiaceae bacterium NEAU-GS5]|nr:Gfo/Idh/MocA family oxidoreductase [Streptosporangiaceae bacterium NEAU-GS5]
MRVAVAGFWHVHAADYAESIRSHDGTELAGVWDDDESRGRVAAEAYGTAFTGDLAALLSGEAVGEVDGIVVTTATSRHRDVMVAAAKAGKHIFTEKLLAPTVAEAEEIIAAADAAGVALVVSLPRLYAGYTTAVQDVLAAGTLGPVSYCRVRLSHDGAITRPTEGPWLPERFFEPETAIGGALTDLGCHPVYLTQLFLGAEPETVTATYRSVTGHQVEDQAVVTVGYADGAIGVIEAGFVSVDDFTIEIFGTDGHLRCTETSLIGAGPAFGAEPKTLPVPGDGPGPFAQWVEHAGAGTRADDNVARALALTRFVVAANAAAATGRTVSYA